MKQFRIRRVLCKTPNPMAGGIEAVVARSWRGRRGALISKESEDGLIRRWGYRIGMGLAWLVATLLLLLATALGYGISRPDLLRMEQFNQAVERWQVNPDFRQVSDEYVRLSHDTLNTHLAGIGSDDVVMFVRSIPFLPEKYSANPGSRKHYDDFTAGDLGAYLHLCGEQGTNDFLGTLEYLGGEQKRGALADEKIREFLAGFHLSTPVAQDAGAIASVRKLLADTNAGPGNTPVDFFGLLRHRSSVVDQLTGKRFEFRHQTTDIFLPYIAALAAEKGWPTQTTQLSAPRQKIILDELDGYVLQRDPELWRTKQVTDFLNGIWGQGYGQTYEEFIGLILSMHAFCLFAAPVMWLSLGGLIYSRLRRRRRRVQTNDATDLVPDVGLPGVGPT